MPDIGDENVRPSNEENIASSNFDDRFLLATFTVVIGRTRNLNGASVANDTPPDPQSKK
jgi:hypothetical protein